MKKVLLFLFVSLFPIISASQTTLSAGDLAIIGINCDNPDDFAFVLLVDIESGTEIKFTDNGWQTSGAFRANEGTILYSAPSNIPAGTTIVYSINSADFSGVSGSFSLASDGDQILVYQGEDSSPNFVFALNNEGAGIWQADATSSNNSALPVGLTNGVNAVALNEVDNAIFNGSTNYSTPSAALSAICNNVNWQGDNTNPYDFTSFGDFSLPVELTSFTARAGDRQVNLRWSTASEVDNQGFAILRSLNEKSDYHEIDSYVNNLGLKGAGNTSEAQNYSYTDQTVTNGLTYWYKLVDIDINGIRTEHGPIFATPHAESVEIDPLQDGIPQQFNLEQNYPNPFNPSTTFSFDIPNIEGGITDVKITVVDLLGREINNLLESPLTPGSYKLEWNGTNTQNQPVPSGIYILHFESDLYNAAQKMTLMR